MPIKFGPAGLGGVKEAINNLRMYHELGIQACEIAFTYGIYIKTEREALEIGKEAEKLGIQLSIHAPYWINLNSAEAEKVHKSRERILECMKVGTWLNAKKIVFHPGFYGKNNPEETYEKIKNEIIKIMDEAKEKHYTSKLAPETTGKINVFGSVEEIFKLVEETNCSFCLDFAHILARYKHYDFKRVLRQAVTYKDIHIHFSGIEYGEKGEKRHIKTPVDELKKLIDALPKNHEIVVINESPEPVEDSVKSIAIYRR